ncbi:MAG: ATP-grasp domain-containing protein [Methylibium sp.]|nr:ATP-grasp domain-containing protein [Methylibium sp.]
MTRSVLVTGARAPVALDLARAFMAAGHSVTLADSVTPFAARWSVAGRGRVLRVPPARHAFRAYREALHAWVADHPQALVVPTCEEVFYVAEAAAQCGFADRVLAPPPTVLRRLHSKIAFAHWARSLGIPAPETTPVASREEVLALASRPRQGLVLKPEFSRFGTATLLQPAPRELQAVDAKPGSRWAAQAYVAGEEICLWACARDGVIVASAAYRPAWRLGRSASFAFEALDCPGALEIAQALAADARISGQLSFDIILRPNGEAVPIECNPRAVSGLHLFDGAGHLARAMLGDGPATHVTRGLTYLGPAMLLLGAVQGLRHGRMLAWARDLRRGKDALAAAGMYAPAGALLDAARFAWVGLSRRRSATRQSTDDIEWNGETIR